MSARLPLVVLVCLAFAMGCDMCPQKACRAPVEVTPPAVATPSGEPLTLYPVARDDEAFLDELQHRIFDFFWNEVYPETGMSIDHTENRIGKVAATGFQLAALCIGVERGWITREQGMERALLIMNSFYDDPEDPTDSYADGHFGLWWHFLDGKTGQMKPVDCVAICDSADFIAGVVVAGEYFEGTEVEELAKKIYDAVEWDQFVDHSTGEPGLLSFGWVPPNTSQTYPDTDGLLGFNMSGLADNSLLIYALALGSDTHPIPTGTWDLYVDSYEMGEYAGYQCVEVGPLFSRQVPHSFIRFSRKRDRRMDYFLDAVNAILADRAFNMIENDYPPFVWGLNDCFGRESYSHGAPPGEVMNDGTVAMTSIAGGVAHVPQVATDSMKYVYEKYEDRVWGKYGFTSSINPQNGFISPLYVGIELGPMIQLIENYRSGLIWDLYSRSDVMKNFLRRAKMAGVVDDFELPVEAPPYAVWTAQGAELALSDDWPQSGKRCLEVQPDQEKVQVSAQLTENDLLAFHFGKYLFIWGRDLAVSSCELTIEGKRTVVEPAYTVTGGQWVEHRFDVPQHEETAELAALTINATVTGARPAIDNISMGDEIDEYAPSKITDFSARAGDLGGCVDFEWTTPEDKGPGDVQGYWLAMSPEAFVWEDAEEGLIPAQRVDLVRAPGEKQPYTIALDDDRDYYFAIAAYDANRHVASFSDVVQAKRNANMQDGIAYDFEDGSTKGWHGGSTGASFRVVGEPGKRVLRVEYHKVHGWDPVWFEVDPRRVVLHRYIKMKIRGDIEVLGKLFCTPEKQKDIERQQAKGKDQWTTISFDTRKTRFLPAEFYQVQSMLLFPEPGVVAEGVFYIDDVQYSDTR